MTLNRSSLQKLFEFKETAKFLGHGICDSLSKSTTFNAPIGDMQTILKEVKQLYDKFNVAFSDLRGIGIQLSKLEKIGQGNSVMNNFLKQSSNKKEFRENEDICKEKFVACVEAQNQIAESQVTEVYSNKKPDKKVFPRNVDDTSIQQIKEIKSKIGRPPGSRSKINIKKKSSSSPMMDKYLQIMVKTPTKVHTIFNSDNIDMNIYHELPEELQNEIRIEYKFKQIQLNEKNNSLSPIENKMSEVDKTKETRHKRSIFEGLNWKDLKIVLKAWMSSEAKPKKVDVEIISEYFRQLAIDRKIEFLKMTLNFLHRCFVKMTCEWHQAYLSIVNTTQKGMIAQYGGTLLVERTFDCCRPKNISIEMITKV